ncbi:MAG TPA: ribulose-phosphate 3-epimerase [Patescibacteria group bacterium]|nr:ribulose-phosphate 3-epimerase [Patescibacteria group bacterium]
MIQILPAILAHDEEEFVRKVDRVRSLGVPLHIDVMDGIFVNNTTWAPPDRMRVLLDGITFEVHLMVSNPEHAVPIWLASGADRVVFHAEATTKERLICRAVTDDCARLGIALNPDTPISRVTPLLNLFDEFMVMGVTPGWSGQPFQEIALEKIRTLRDLRPSLMITVDGGVKPENASALVEAGATRITSGSGLTEHPDPAEAFLRLKEIVNGPTTI